jgi:hypothetical protein
LVGKKILTKDRGKKTEKTGKGKKKDQPQQGEVLVIEDIVATVEKLLKLDLNLFFSPLTIRI